MPKKHGPEAMKRTLLEIAEKLEKCGHKKEGVQLRKQVSDKNLHLRTLRNMYKRRGSYEELCS
jgi:hypothetical protein